jgi:hypothetical protein
MSKSLIPLAAVFLVFACKENQKVNSRPTGDSYISDTTLVILDDNNTPTVDLSKYILIKASHEDRELDVNEILRVKRKWPLAMQSLNPLEFDSILSKNFTFKGSDSFFNRADYIENRSKSDEWKIIFVKYDNVTLQFFEDIGVLSYVNHITNKNSNTGAIEYEHISWVDIYILEDGKWKIRSAHSIDYRLEVQEK